MGKKPVIVIAPEDVNDAFGTAHLSQAAHASAQRSTYRGGQGGVEIKQIAVCQYDRLGTIISFEKKMAGRFGSLFYIYLFHSLCVFTIG